MERLDSALFRIPELVDYRARWDGTLNMECLWLSPDAEETILAAARSVYPEVEFRISGAIATREYRPMNLGKRYV